MTIDAIVNWGNGKGYAFEDTFYTRIDLSTGLPDPGYPAEIAWGWRGLPAAPIDAVFVKGDGKAYFFTGSAYHRYDMATSRVDPGYPRAVDATTWPGWPFKSFDRIDAVVTRADGKAYFFVGKEYARFDMASGRFDIFYPLPITNETWPGLGLRRVTAAFTGDLRVPSARGDVAEPCYFFDGNDHVLFDLAADRRVGINTCPVVQIWPGRPSFDRTAPRDLLARTDRFIATLADISTATAAGDVAAAKAHVAALRPTVEGYLTTISAFLAASDGMIAHLRDRATSLSDNLQAFSIDLGELSEKLGGITSQLKSLGDSLGDTRDEIKDLEDRLGILDTERKALQAKRDELEKWFWVPGYGAYLGIRELSEGNQGKLASARTEIGERRKRLDRNMSLAQRDTTLQTVLTGRLSQMQRDHRRLAADDRRAHYLLAVCKARTAFLGGTQQMLGQLRTLADDLGGAAVDRLDSALRRMNDVAMPADRSVLNRRQATFANGLRDFAFAMDLREDFLTFYPATGNFIRCTNHSDQLADCHVYLRDRGHAMLPIGPWIREGRTQNYDIRGLGLTDLQVFHFQVRNMNTNRIVHSADVRYLDQPEIERVTFDFYDDAETGPMVAHVLEA